MRYTINGAIFLTHPVNVTEAAMHKT